MALRFTFSLIDLLLWVKIIHLQLMFKAVKNMLWLKIILPVASISSSSDLLNITTIL